MKDKLQSLFSIYDENVVVIENSNTSELFEVRTEKHGTYFVCAKELTFGGRENLDYEQRFEKYRVIQDRLFMSDFDKYILELEENAKK